MEQGMEEPCKRRGTQHGESLCSTFACRRLTDLVRGANAQPEPNSSVGLVSAPSSSTTRVPRRTTRSASRPGGREMMCSSSPS
jgi:hypothetical protein